MLVTSRRPLEVNRLLHFMLVGLFLLSSISFSGFSTFPAQSDISGANTSPTGGAKEKVQKDNPVLNTTSASTNPTKSTPNGIARLKPENLPAGLYAALLQNQQAAGGPAYALKSARAGSGTPDWQATNNAHNLKLNFAQDGVKINGWGIKLASFGAETTGNPAMTVSGNRVDYRHANGLTEWYVNGPSGLEQGFNLAGSLPQMGGDGWLTLPVSFEGARVRSNGDESDWLQLVGSNGGSLGQYGKLYASDANGKVLDSHLDKSADGQKALLRVNLAGASYPVVIDPLVQQGGLTASDGTYNDQLGYTVAVSDDGNTALLSAYLKDNGANNDQGAAYVFTRSGSTWTQQQTLTSSDGTANNQFGISVALNSAGTVALVGATGSDAAYVFTLSGGSWSQQQKLTPSGGSGGENFGIMVDLSSDGTTALVGASNSGGTKGTAYVFTFSSGSWSQQQKLTASDGVNSASLGYSVGLSSDGNTALLSSSGNEAAYVFTRSGSTWTQQQKLTASDGVAGDGFGWSVAVSGDGDTALVGSYQKDVGANTDQGAAYVFTRAGSTWTEQETLKADDGSGGDAFGWVVTLSSDGLAALVGSPYSVGSEGSAYLFTFSGGSWSQQQKLTPSDAADADNFGYGVALSEDGSTAVVGVPFKTIGVNSSQGKVYIFSSSGGSGGTWTEQETFVAADGAVQDNTGYSVDMSSDGNTAIAGAYQKKIGANTGQGAAYIYVRSGSTWTQQQLLTASDGAASDNFGYWVALSGDGNTALVGAAFKKVGANAAQGVVYVFTRSGTTWTEQQKLTASDGAATDNFGNTVTLSEDGNTALFGVSGKKIGANASQGAAYVFTRSGGTWSEQQKLTAADGVANDSFGVSVALNSDGNTAIVGAYNKEVGANSQQGAVYVYTRSGGTWSLQQTITATDGAKEDYFGVSVALSGDGNTALIGAYNKNIGANNGQGKAYVFTRSGSTWSEQQGLTAADGAAADVLAFAVSLSTDGNTALIGAFQRNVGANSQQGAAYVFTRSGATWAEQQTLTSSDGTAGDAFGYALALSGDASTAVVGAFAKMIGANSNQGEVYFFIFNPESSGSSSTTALTRAPNPSTFGQSVTFTATITPITATGTVTFTIDGTDTGPVTLASGVATYTTSSLIAGSHPVTATYSGDSALSGSTSTTVTQTVGLNTTTTGLTSVPNPSILGDSVTFTATVSPVAATGTVTFTIDSAAIPVALSAGLATYITDTLSLGSHPVTATYGGDASYAASTSTPITQVVNASCAPLIVTAIEDDGTGTNCGTLSYALSQPITGSTPITISFSLTQGNIITFTGSLTTTAKVKAGVTIYGGVFGTANRITLNGNNVPGDGLHLSGNNYLVNLTIVHFGGKELVLETGSKGNKMQGVKIDAT